MPSTDLSGARVAIVMMSAIGDAVHALPVVNSLRAAAPGIHITWIIQPGPHALVANHPAVDEFVIFDRKRGWRAFADVRSALRGRRFDLVIALQVYLKAGLVTALIDSPRKLGFDRERARDFNWLFTTERIAPRGQRHVQDQYIEFLEHLGVPPLLEWGLGPTEDEAARYAPLLDGVGRPRAAFVVGTSKPGKEWPAERYAKVIDVLEGDLGVRTMLVGGRSPRELEAAATIERLARHRPLNLLEWDLRRLVYLIDQSDVLVSPDTGPLHAGVALGTPTVALMGYTNPKRVGPYRRFPDLLIDAYGDPGEDYPVSAEYRPGHMERITPEQVLEKVELALRAYPGAEREGSKRS